MSLTNTARRAVQSLASSSNNNMLARRSSTITSTSSRVGLEKRFFRSSAVQKAGGHHHYTPPLPPFARIPPPTEPLAENNDAIWDDGVAPELALDFDMPHMSSREALGTWMFGFGVFFAFYQFLKLVRDPNVDNPALSHSTMLVEQDYGNVGDNKPTNGTN